VLQRVAVCCSVLQCVLQPVPEKTRDSCCSVLPRVAACCSVLQCVAVRYTARSREDSRLVLQCVAVCCSVLQCVAVCCSVLQCVIQPVPEKTRDGHQNAKRNPNRNPKTIVLGLFPFNFLEKDLER